MNIGLHEVLLFLAIVLLLFGAKKLPELARALGRSMNEFKKGREDGSAAPPESKDSNKDKPEST